MRNILFSTTRQWNVGDEFILYGAINLMKSVFPEGFNSIIYNRHPDLRTEIQPTCNLHNVKLLIADGLTAAADANFRVGFRDNSFKLSTDGQFIDLVVFAGTPEWSNSRCYDLYEIIEKFDLPVIALGIGNSIQDECELVLRNLNRFKLFTVRSPEFIETLSEHITPQPQYLPCPSLCSSSPEKIRFVDVVKHIGLIYSCDVNRSEINNCVSTETYDYLLILFQHLKRIYPEFRISLVCHYIDELPFAHSDFPGTEVLYSYDAKDYYDIYNRFDLVIGARVHGIGCAASMGIPGICVTHDFRGHTVNGFLAETLSVNQPLESALETVKQTIANISEKNQLLTDLIGRTANCYVALISNTFDLPVKSFEGYSPQLLPPVGDVFKGRPALLDALQRLLGFPNPLIVERDRAISERDLALAERDSALEERNKAISERVQAITELNSAVTERDSATKLRDQVIIERDSALAIRDQVVIERDNAIAERNHAVAERDNAITEREHAITEQGKTLAMRDQAITERDSALAICDQVIKERDDAIMERNQAITERDGALIERDIFINSTSWKITAPVRAILDFLKRFMKGTK